MKQSISQGYFLTRGLTNVHSEMSLTVLAYGIKWGIRAIGIQGLIVAGAG